MNIAYLEWSLEVTCPNCNEGVDLSEDDADYVVARKIFHNERDKLKGHECVCNWCNFDFELDGVEY